MTSPADDHEDYGLDITLDIDDDTGDFDYEWMGLRIVGKHKGDGSSNSDTLTVTIYHDGNGPPEQQFEITGGNLEIPAFYEFITQLAARLALLRGCR